MLMPAEPVNEIQMAENDVVDIAYDAMDPDGDDVELQVVSPPSHGTLDTALFPTVRYTPDTDFTGTDSFTLRLWGRTGLQLRVGVAFHQGAAGR